LSRFRRQRKNARIARRATAAIGTTTAIATIPPFDNPVLPVAAAAVALDVDVEKAVEMAGVEDTGVEFTGWLVGRNVLVEVCVIVMTLLLFDVVGVLGGEVFGGGEALVVGGTGVLLVVGVVGVVGILGVEVVGVSEEVVGVTIDVVGAEVVGIRVWEVSTILD